MSDTESGCEPEDDLSVQDPTLLYRWVPPTHIRRTDSGVECRDGAFKNFPNKETNRMSVVLQDTLEALDRLPATILADRPGYGLVAVTAADVRAEKQKVLRSPQSHELAHGDVWGGKTPARRRLLAQKATWVIEPE
ncbi:MAG: hypothetical protein WKF96_16425 [Solirubrobacteraceae bacterium]